MDKECYRVIYGVSIATPTFNEQRLKIILVTKINYGGSAFSLFTRSTIILRIAFFKNK